MHDYEKPISSFMFKMLTFFLHSGCFIYPILCRIIKTTIPLKQVKEEVTYKHMVVNTQPMHISKIFQIYLTIISMCLKKCDNLKHKYSYMKCLILYSCIIAVTNINNAHKITRMEVKYEIHKLELRLLSAVSLLL